MVYLVRGNPGSGKSTFAKSLSCLHLEADMWFIKNGKYVYNKQEIKEAHDWCFSLFCLNALKEMDIVISNTFSQYWEIKRYIDFCDNNNLEYRIIRCTKEYQNQHEIPKEIVQRFKDRFEDIEGEILL